MACVIRIDIDVSALSGPSPFPFAAKSDVTGLVLVDLRTGLSVLTEGARASDYCEKFPTEEELVSAAGVLTALVPTMTRLAQPDRCL